MAVKIFEEKAKAEAELGLNIDMLDADRLREWARLLLVHGADISHWASVPHVASKLQTIATGIEKEVRDVGKLRARVRELEAALTAVVRVADRKTDEFDTAKAALAKAIAEAPAPRDETRLRSELTRLTDLAQDILNSTNDRYRTGRADGLLEATEAVERVIESPVSPSTPHEP